MLIMTRHRLSTVMNADIIFVVSEGEVVEQGSHEELLERKGKYSELWSKQIFVKPKEQKTVTKSDASAMQPEALSTKKGQSANASCEYTASSSTADTSKAPTASGVEQTSTARGKRQATTPRLVTTPSKTSDEHKKEVDQSKNP